MLPSVLIIDDHEVVRQGLRALIEDTHEFRVVGEAGTAEEALRRAKRIRPTIAIVDLSLPGTNGLQLMRVFRDKFPKTKLLVLSMHVDEAYLGEAMKIGAVGYIVKGTPSSEIVAGLRAVSRGETFFKLGVPVPEISLDIRTGSDPGSAFARLTQREIEVLSLVAHGLTSKLIGERLNIAARTVESHRAHISRKLDLHSYSDLLAYAVRHSLLTDDDSP